MNYTYPKNPYLTFPTPIVYKPDNGVFGFINSDDMEELTEYIDYLINYIKYNNFPCPDEQTIQRLKNNNSLHLCDFLNSEIQRITGNNSQQFNSFISVMKSDIAYKNNQKKFDETQILWLKDNPRACYFFYTLLIQEKNKEPSILECYEKLNILHQAIGHNARYNLIKAFFIDSSYGFKARLINNIQSSWNFISSAFPRPLKWLPDNQEDREWAIDYFYKNHQYSTDIIQAVNSERDFPLEVLFDSMSSMISDKKLFLIQINKAWHQFKQRKKKEGKKAINVYLSVQEKEGLDHLRKVYGKSTEKMIGILIMDKLKTLRMQKLS